MKRLSRILSVIICLALTLTLSACGKSEEVVSTESLISEIGTISFNSKETISEAEKAYNALSAEDKEQVSNYTDLETAKESYADLMQSLEESLCIYIANQPERNGCAFDKLSVSSITMNTDDVTITGTATFSSDQRYICNYTAIVRVTDDASNSISVESWEDDFDAVYKAAQPVHWEVAYYVDDFGDATDEWYLRGIFEGDFDNSAGYGHDLLAILFFDQHLDSASYDRFSIRLLEYGDKPASLSSDTFDITIKIKVDGKVYSDTPDYIWGNDIYIERGSEIFRGVIQGLNAGKEISFIISNEKYYGSKVTYNFKIDAFGLDDIPHSWDPEL